MNEISRSDEKTISRLTVACMVAVASICGVALLGWITGLLLVAQGVSQFIPMAPSSALMFLLLSACWVAYRRQPVWPHSRILASIGTFLVMLTCSILLVGFLDGVTFDFGIFLVPNPAKFGLVPIGRMSPITALAFLLAGLSLLLLIHPITRRSGSLSSGLGVAVSYVGFVIVVGYLFGVPVLYGSTIIPVALTTAVALVLLGIGLFLSTGPGCWPSNRLFGSSVHARLLRPFLLLTVAITLFYGWYSAQAKLVQPALTNSLVLFISVTIVGVVVSRIAQTVGDRIGRAEEALRKSVNETAAMVGHDLRNPLQGIAGATYVLKEQLGPRMDEKVREMLQLIENGVEYSDKIINDLLDYSGEMQLNLVETCPKLIAKDALRSIKVPKNLTIQDLTEEEPRLKVDAIRTRRVFVNLIQNAIDAMPGDGKLTMGSKILHGNLEVTFTDTGVGIPKEVMENLWKPLRTTKAKGMGLGLPICKRIVEAHGGSISVESKVGKGTTIIVELPIKPVQKEVNKT